MKRKIILGLLAGLVIGLWFTYHTSLVQERNEQFIANAYYGDLLALKENLEDGADLNFVFYFNDEEREYTNVTFNALHAAASSGNEDIINYLLEQGLDINSQTPDGWTPLFIATRDGNTEAAKLLIFREADLNIQTNLGATALLMAVTQKYPSEKERVDLLTYMLKRGADPNLSAENGHTPLFYGAVAGNIPVVKLLLEYGANVTPQFYQSTQAYMKAKHTPNAQKITALLKKKAVGKK